MITLLGEVPCDTAFTLLENTRVQRIVVYERYLIVILYEESWIIAMLKLALKPMGFDDGNVEMTEINSSWVYHGKTIESEVRICREDVTIRGPSSLTYLRTMAM